MMTEPIFSFIKKLTKNKNLSVCLWKYKNKSNAYFYFQCGWSFKGDHAGFFFELEIRNYSFEFEIRDGRHWNYEKDAWQEYDENDMPIP